MTTSTASLLTAGINELQLNLSEAQQQQLLAFVALLAKWNKVYNLTALRDPLQMVTHHLLDTLAAAPSFSHAQRVLDVGAGGGVPGLVLAIVYPQIQFALIDIVHKKTAFLTQAKAELGLKNVTVHTGRVEQLQVAEKFDCITSRAFAELADFVNWSGHLLADGGEFIAMKGVRPEEEMAALPAGWYVRATLALHVPQLDAERHLIFIRHDEA